jgi:hypothetical protein
MSTIINRKTAVKAGLVAGRGALAGAPVIATAKAASYSSCYREDYSISCSSDYYYWRRWQLPRRNRLLQQQRRLLLRLRLRLWLIVKNIGGQPWRVDSIPANRQRHGKAR